MEIEFTFKRGSGICSGSTNGDAQTTCAKYAKNGGVGMILDKPTH